MRFGGRLLAVVLVGGLLAAPILIDAAANGFGADAPAAVSAVDDSGRTTALETASMVVLGACLAVVAAAARRRSQRARENP